MGKCAAGVIFETVPYEALRLPGLAVTCIAVRLRFDSMFNKHEAKALACNYQTDVCNKSFMPQKGQRL